MVREKDGEDVKTNEETFNPILAATLVAAKAPLDSIHILHEALKAFTGFLLLYFIDYHLCYCGVAEAAPLVAPRPNPPMVKARDPPTVTGARSRPTRVMTPPTAPTYLPATLEISEPFLILSSWTAQPSMSSRNWSILG
ncbi:unnamed protein product [Arctogadus glacialis]